MELSDKVTLCRCGKIVQVHFNGATSLPTIPDGYRPKLNETRLVGNIVKSVVRIFVYTDGTMKVYEGSTQLSTFELYCDCMWICE